MKDIHSKRNTPKPTVEKKTKRNLALLLSLMLVGTVVLTGCGGGDGHGSSPSAATSATGADAAETEPVVVLTAAETIAARYTNTDLNGYTYKVLAIPVDGHFYTQVGTGINEVYSAELNGEIINDAIYNRNSSAESTLNFTLEPVWGDSTEGIRTQVHNEVLAASTGYDAVFNRMDFLGTNMLNGDLLNIKNISSINTEDYWWDRNIVDSFTLFGSKLYWISGDLNIFDDFATEGVFFNKKICSDNNMEYPYATVLEGKWTIDRFLTMAKTAERDVNGDGKLVVDDDIVGHCEVNDHVKHWMYAMGEKAADIGADGSLTVRLQEERQIRAVDKLYNCMVTQGMTYTGKVAQFRSGHVLFWGNMLGSFGGLREMEDEFGVLPMPKMDEQQESYGEYISNGWCTAYGIPMTNSDPERTGKVLDAICGYSHETLRNALYDTLFGAKFVRDPESVEMLDIIFDSKMFDWAVDFSWGVSFKETYNGIYSDSHDSTNNFVSQTQAVMSVINKNMEDLITTVKGLKY